MSEPENPDVISLAESDALQDAIDEYGDLVQCYFGMVVLINDDELVNAVMRNLLIPDAESHAEAVGLAYLAAKEDYPLEEGWRLVQLSIEEIPVWVDRVDIRDAEQPYRAEEHIDRDES